MSETKTKIVETEDGRVVHRVSIKMTWAGNVRILMALLRDGETFEARKTAEDEITKMAYGADMFNTIQPVLDKLKEASAHLSQEEQDEVKEVFSEMEALADRYNNLTK